VISLNLEYASLVIWNILEEPKTRNEILRIVASCANGTFTALTTEESTYGIAYENLLLEHALSQS
jgi:arsenate reductase-like glutaredoxin family protein